MSEAQQSITSELLEDDLEAVVGGTGFSPVKYPTKVKQSIRQSGTNNFAVQQNGNSNNFNGNSISVG